MVAQFLIGALAKAHGPDDIPPLLADDPSDPFAINSDPFSVLNLAGCHVPSEASLAVEVRGVAVPQCAAGLTAVILLSAIAFADGAGATAACDAPQPMLAPTARRRRGGRVTAGGARTACGGTCRPSSLLSARRATSA